MSDGNAIVLSQALSKDEKNRRSERNVAVNLGQSASAGTDRQGCERIIISASLAIKAEHSGYVIDLSSVPSLSAHRYCGKTADWIGMPFGVVSVVGLRSGVLDFGGDRRRGRGSLGGEFAASRYNQWGLCCIVVWKCVKRSSCRLA